MAMVKEALTELDQRRGVSAQAIRAFIKDKYTTVNEARLKLMLRKALVKGIESGLFVRPANATTTGAQGRFRLAVRKPKSLRKETNENTNPNISKARGPTAKAAAVMTKKTNSVVETVERIKRNDVVASKVAPARKPKAKRIGAATNRNSESKSKISQSKGEHGEKSHVRKRGKKAVPKAEGGSGGGSGKEDQKYEAESTVQKMGAKKRSPKGPRASRKKVVE